MTDEPEPPSLSGPIFTTEPSAVRLRFTLPPVFKPEHDITAYDLWRCCTIGPALRGIEDVPEDLLRHFVRAEPPV